MLLSGVLTGCGGATRDADEPPVAEAAPVERHSCSLSDDDDADWEPFIDVDACLDGDALTIANVVADAARAEIAGEAYALHFAPEAVGRTFARREGDQEGKGSHRG